MFTTTSHKLCLQDDFTDPLSVFDLFVNCLFLWDVWMNFHTAYLSEWGGPRPGF